MKKFLIVISALPAALITLAQNDVAHWEVSAQTSVSSGGNNPFWLNANRYGLSSLDTSNGYMRASLGKEAQADSTGRFTWGGMLDMAAAFNYTSDIIIQQAYVEGRWGKGVLTIGSKEFPMELKSQTLSTGSQTLGINARPVPQVRMALQDYWALPFTKGWFSVKGHLSYGKTTDEGWQKDFSQKKSRFTENVLYHSKAGYLRIGDSRNDRPLSFTVGLEMASQFGGTTYLVDGNGNILALENDKGLDAFLTALIPGGADTSEDVYQNARGNVVGSWVARLDLDYPKWALGLYADHYFEDHSSMFFLDYDGYGEGSEWDEKKDSRFLMYQLKDIMLGLELKLKDFSLINNIVAEYIYTKYQSGPIYHDHTQQMPDHIGGIDNYYNHHLYTGWQHWGQAMGNPLYTSPIYNDDGIIEFKNNRFVAYHIGISGQPAKNLSYRLLSTWQKSYGTYKRPYPDPKHGFYCMGEVSCNLPKHWNITAAMALDRGKQTGNNFGVQVTVAKSGVLGGKNK
ncbi:MAG: capsule assembly Wzi family protein [Prevotella sp.]